MKKNILLLVVFIIFITGCVQNSLYYWGGYSNSLYKHKKDPNNETIQAHKESILKIIEKSDYYGKKIPPGVYCEYGYYMLQENNYTEAKKYLNLEIKLYPESNKFVNILLKEIKIKEEKE